MWRGERRATPPGRLITLPLPLPPLPPPSLRHRSTPSLRCSELHVARYSAASTLLLATLLPLLPHLHSAISPPPLPSPPPAEKSAPRRHRRLQENTLLSTAAITARHYFPFFVAYLLVDTCLLRSHPLIYFFLSTLKKERQLLLNHFLVYSF